MGGVTKKCQSCGYNNGPSATTCQLCNYELDVKPGGGRASTTLLPPESHVFGSGATRRFGMAAERHFLQPPVGDNVRLEPGFTYLMGREASCQIHVASEKVSRKHAEIRFEGQPPSPFVHDLGSQNGTTVNGTRLPSRGSHELKNGDTIEVGGISLSYWLLPPGVSESTLRGDVGATLPDQPQEEHEAGLAGNTTILPLAAVLKRLETLGATGILRVDAGAQKGFVRFERGKVVGSSFAGLEDAQAAAALAALTTGKFRFEAAEAEPREIPGSSPAAPPPPVLPARRAPTLAPKAAPPPARPVKPRGSPGAPPPAPPRPDGA